MHVDYHKWYIPQIDKRKLRELSKRRNIPGLIHFFIYFFTFFFFGYLSYLSWGTWWFLLFFFIYSTIYAFSVCNWHETLHRTAFKTRWLNDLFFHISSFMLNLDGFSSRWSHIEHHSNTLRTEGEYDHEIEISRPTDLLKFFLNFIPLTGLIYIHRSSFVHTCKMAFSIKDYNARIHYVPDNEWWKCVWSARITILIWVLIIIYAFYISSILPILFYFLPAYFGKPIHFAINVTQHLAAKLDTKDHRLSTHTVIINPILSFYYWHMEYHLEHHMFPMVPSYNLKKLRKEIDDQLPQPFYGLFDFYKNVLPSLIKLAFDLNEYYKAAVPENKLAKK